jgi:molecular chaperone DnaK (HSP70)
MTAHPEDTNVVFIDKFKLKLHDLFEEFREQVKSQPTTEKNVSDRDYNIHLMAAIDYLRELHQYTCTQLIENEGPTATLDKFRYVLTVPATWVKKDDFSMKSIIAEEAGLITLSKDPSEKVIILSEAHAAALFCEREYCVTQENKSKLHKGQRYLVCDAGGGTVDLSTYECIGTDQKEQKFLKNEHCQLALESGGSCGSTILEHNMEKYLREQIFLGCIEETVLKQLVDQFIKEIKVIYFL